METNIGADEVGNGSDNSHSHIEEVFHDASDGNCLGNGRKEDSDESDALGRSGYMHAFTLYLIFIYKFVFLFTEPGHQNLLLVCQFQDMHPITKWTIGRGV